MLALLYSIVVTFLDISNKVFKEKISLNLYTRMLFDFKIFFKKWL